MHPKRFFDPELQQQYFHSLSSRGLSAASIKRKQSCFSTFKKFAQKKRFYSPEAPITYPTLANAATLPAPAPPSPASKPPFDFRRFFNIYSLGALFLLILSGLSWGIYSQFISQARQNLAFSTVTNPIRPGRILSFQGRLTDSSGNPIISSTPIVFKLWNSESVGTGTSLYVSSTGNSQTVTPDDNGIFSVVIGKSHGLEISPSVFTENAEVWLEITAGGETMSPRQQIATVAYALNSETLQGLTIGTSGIGYKNTVAVFDDQGNLNLGETSPTIKSISGTLGIEGQAMLIKASDGSGGNITLNPDAAGIIRLVTEGTGSTAVGGFIEATNANLSSGNLYSGIINNDNRGYNFLEFKNFQAGTTISETRFSIGASGNLYLSGNAEIGATLNSSNISIGNTLLLASASQINYLTGIGSTIGSLIYHTGSNLSNLPQGTSGHLLQSNGVGATPTWVLSSAVGQTYSVLNGLSSLSANVFGLGGTLTQNTTIGTSSFGLSFVGINSNTQSLYIGANGRIGVGTTNPGEKVEVSGNIKLTNGTPFISLNTGTTNYGYLAGGNAAGFFTDGLPNALILSSANTSAIQIGSGSTSDMTITTAGNVGVGTTNPQYGKLEIASSASNTGGLALYNGTGSTARSWITSSDVWLMQRGSTDSNGIAINASGFLGIGTTNPTYKLDMGGFAANDQTLRISTASNYTSQAKFMELDDNFGFGLAYVGSANRFDISSYSNGTKYEAISILRDSSQFVGIGTTAPLYKLQVAGSALIESGNKLGIGATGAAVLNVIGNGYFSTALTVGTSLSVGGNVGIGGTLSLTGTNVGTGTTALFIAADGSITKRALGAGAFSDGIGTTYSVTNGLSSTSSNVFGLGGTLTQNTTIGTSSFGLNFIGINSNTQALFIDSNGDVGLGTTNPGAKLVVQGTADGVNSLVNITNSGTGRGLFIDATNSTNVGFMVQTAASTNLTTGRVFSGNIAGDAYARFMFYSDGKYGIGSGSADRDIFIDRSSVNTLRVSSDAGTGLGNLVITGNVGIGGTLDLDGTALGTGTTALMIASNGTVSKRALSPLAFDFGTYDNYNHWKLQANGTGTTNILTSNTVNFVNGTGISLAQSGSTITINNTSLGTTYAAGVGLSLTATNIFNVNLGTGLTTNATNQLVNAGVLSLTGTSNQIIVSGAGGTGALTLSLPQGIGTTSNVTFRNLSLGGTFVSVGSTNTTTNLSADYLDGYNSSYFVNVGQTANFVTIGYTGFFNTALNGLQKIGSTGVGLGGTLTQNTNINLSSYGLSFLGTGNTQSLYLAPNGKVGIGTTTNLAAALDIRHIASNTNVEFYGLYLNHTATPIYGDSSIGIYAINNANGSIASNGPLYGGLFYSRSSGTNISSQIGGGFMADSAGYGGAISTQYGGRFLATVNATASDMSAPNQYAGYFQTGSINRTTNSVTNSYNLFVDSPQSAGTTGSIGSLYGLYVNNMNHGTNRYAIVTNAGNIVFNEGGDANTDLRIEGDTDQYLITTNSSTNNVGIGISSPLYKLQVAGDVGVSTSLTVGTSLSVIGNVGLGGTLSLTGTNVGTGTTALFVDSSGIVTKRALGTMAFDSGTYDNYNHWKLQANGAGTTNILSSNTVNFVNGTGISLAQTGSTITINNTSVGTTYASGVGLTLSNTNVFSLDYDSTLDLAGNKIGLNLGSTNVWLAPQYFSLGLGVTGNSTFQNNLSVGQSLTVNSHTLLSGNLTIGGTFVSVGSTNLVTNLNANYLNGRAESYFVNIGQTGNFLSIGYTGFLNTALNGLQKIGSTGVGLGGTLSQNTSIGLSSFSLNFVGINSNTQALYIASNGRVGVGTTLINSTFAVNSTYDFSTYDIFSFANQNNPADFIGTVTSNTDWHAPRFWFARARGTSESSPQSVVDGDNIFELTGRGRQNGGWRLASSINSYVDGTPSGNNVPGAISFNINNGVGETTAMIIRSSGYIGIGTGSPTSKLHVVGNGNISTSLSVGTSLDVGSTATIGSLVLDNTSVGTGTTILYIDSSGVITKGTLPQMVGATYAAGIGISISSTNVISNIGVTSILGTANQVNVSGSTGAVTLSLPQNIHTGANPTFAKLGLGSTSASYTLNVVGNGYFSTALTVGTSLSVVGNVGVGGTLDLDGTAIGTGTTALMIASNGTVSRRGLGTMAFDSGTYDNYNHWKLQTNGAGTTNILSSNTVNFVNGTGISLAQTGSTITINNTSVGTTYASGVGLTLSNTNVFSLDYDSTLDLAGNKIGLNLGSTNVWLAPQYFSLGLGVTGNSTFTNSVGIGGSLGITGNLTVGNSFVSVGSSNIVTNLNADLLDGYNSTYFVNVGQTGNFLQVGYTGFFNTALNGLQKIGSTGVGLGGTLSQNTNINLSSYSLSYLGLGNTQSLYLSSSGNVGIGNTSAAYKLHLTDSSTTYTAYFYNSSTSPSAAGLYLRTDGSGDILTLNAGGTDVVNITAAAANFNLPTSFNSSGGLSVAYNLLFTNPASSSITAQAPLTIQTDSPSDNLDLTLQAANTGQVIINDSAQIADNLIIGGTLSLTGTNVGTGSTILYIDSSGIVTKGTLPSTSSHTASNGITLSSFDFRLGGLINQATSIGISNASYLNFTGLGGTQALFIGTTGYVGIGTTNPQYKLHVVGNIGTTGNATIGGTLTVTNSIIGARFTDSTSFPKYFIQPSNSDSTKASLSLYRDGSIRFNFNEDDGTHIATGNAARIQGYSNGLLLSSSTSTTGTISGWDSQLFLENGTGNVGIGTTNPGSKLEVFGEVSISNSSGNGLLIANSGANVELQFMGENASNIYSESSDLYFRLDSNNTAGNGTYRFLNGGSTEILTLYQDAGYSRLNTNTAGFWIDENLGLSNELLLFNANSGGGIKFKTGGSLQIVDTGVNPYVHFDATSKYVGIGTTNPTSALTVQGTDWNGITLNSTGTALLRATPSGGGAFVIDNASSSGTYLMQGGSTKNIFTSSGWLGIGITSNAPTGLLHVGTTFSTPALFVSSSNLVGIGTTSPLASLHIGSTATSGLHESLRLNFRRQTGGYGSKISFADPTDNTEWGRIAFGSHAFGGMNNGFTFGVYGTIGYKDEMHLNENGLGIGTTAPGYRLDVNGNARIGTTLIVPQISSANSTNLFIGAGLNGKTILAAGGTGVGSTGSGSIYFYKSDGTTSAGRLDTTAALGTGTTVFHIGFTGNGVGSSTSFNMSSNTFRVGQVLTMPNSIGGNLSAVTLKIGCSNSASNNNNISMKFFPNVDVGGTPTGSPVLSVGKSISSLNSYPTFNEVTFTFSNGTLTAGALQAFDIGGTYNANPCYLNYFTSTGADPSNSQYALKSENAGVGWTKYTPFGTTYAELWYKLWRTSNYGLLYVSGVVTDSADVAENYSSDDSLKPGDLVSANPDKYGYIQKADPSRPDLLYGVISTSPGVLMGKPDIPEANKYPVALNGRVPTNFSLENGPVDPGDPITLSSTLPGVGMKAISAGYIIGKAITGSQNCLPGEICSIEVLIQPNWYDPDAFLQATDSGLITYSGNIDPENIVSLGYLSAAADLPQTSNYSLTSSLGHTIKRLGQYAHLSTAELQAGLVKSKNIISDITLSKTSISEKVVTSLISPRSSVGIGTTLTIDSDTSITGSLFARDVAATWATIDHLIAQTLQVSDLQVTSVTANSASIKDLTTTDATVSGLALLNQISAKEATISALYADSIISKEGSFTDLMTQKISTLRQEIQNTLTSMSGTTTPVPDLNYTLLSQSTSWLAEISSDSATISGNLSLTDNLVIGGQLAVAGQAQLASALITGDLQVGQIQLNSNQIEAVASSLYLQPSATGSVHIMGDTLVIAENGQVHINGNLSLTGKLIAQEASVSGSLTALLINASEASIAGTLKANTVETENLRIAASPAVTIASPSESTASATQTAVASNTIAGTAILPAGSTQLVVYNQKLTPSSMVYLTPVGSTNNQVLYLKDKTISPTPTESPDSQSRFTIALDQPLNHPVEVNWWIIN